MMDISRCRISINNTAAAETVEVAPTQKDTPTQGSQDMDVDGLNKRTIEGKGQSSPPPKIGKLGHPPAARRALWQLAATTGPLVLNFSEVYVDITMKAAKETDAVPWRP